MKTQEELNALKEEVETVKGKLAELTEEELELVAGGKVKGQRDTSVSFADCPQGEEFRNETCVWCEHRDICWPTGILGGSLAN